MTQTRFRYPEDSAATSTTPTTTTATTTATTITTSSNSVLGHNRQISQSTKDENAAGRFGIRDKWKKITSCHVSHRLNTDTEECGTSSDSNCDSDHLSETGMMESVDLETPTGTPSPRNQNPNRHRHRNRHRNRDRSGTQKHATKNNKKSSQKNSASALALPRRKTMNMLTPDMLETLGLTEVEPEYTHTYTHATATAADPLRTITNSKTVRIDEERNTTRHASNHHHHHRKNSYRQRQSILRRSDADTGYVSSSSSSYSSASSAGTNSSASESYEPIPRAPDDWTIEETSENDDGKHSVNSNALMGASCLGSILSLPLACGLLCLDHIVDPPMFPTIQKMSKAKARSKSGTYKSRTTGAKEKHHRRRASESDLEDARSIQSSGCESGCEYFPSSMELPAYKIIAPCW